MIHCLFLYLSISVSIYPFIIHVFPTVYTPWNINSKKSYRKIVKVTDGTRQAVWL